MSYWVTSSAAASTWASAGKSDSVVNKNSGNVAEVFQGSAAAGAVVDQWTVTGGDNQIWQMTVP